MLSNLMQLYERKYLNARLDGDGWGSIKGGQWTLDTCNTALKFNLTNECVGNICNFYVGCVCVCSFL